MSDSRAMLLWNGDSMVTTPGGTLGKRAVVRVPTEVVDIDSFRRWARSDSFPERGRIDWIDGEVVFDMSPEDVNTHGLPKAAVAAGLIRLIEDAGRGVVLIDSTRASTPDADLSSEPDVMVVLFETIESGRARLVPKADGREGRYVEIEGPADLACECVSDSSVGKDRRRLFERYHRAGVPEYGIVDARGDEVELAVFVHTPKEYVASPRDADGFAASPLVGRGVRLVRLPPRAGLVRYRLEAA